MIHQKIESDLKSALKTGDREKAGVLRFLISAVKNHQIELKKKDQEFLSDEDIITVIRRQVKQRKDSIDGYKQGGRSDLAEKEKKELEILDKYLPLQMSEEEVRKVVDQKAEELGVSDKSGFGKLMGAVMKELQGKTDGNVVKKQVEEKFS